MLMYSTLRSLMFRLPAETSHDLALDMIGAAGRLRLAGYQKALKDHELPMDEELICRMKQGIESYSYQNGYVIMRELLEKTRQYRPNFTAGRWSLWTVCHRD